MKTISKLVLLVCLLFMGNIVYAQEPRPEEKTEDLHNHEFCGFKPYSKEVADEINAKSAQRALTTFPSNWTTVNCGNFRVIYEQDPGSGFYAPDSTIKRNCVCNVLQYIESVVDVNVDVNAGDDPIEILFTASQNNSGSSTLAFATPLWPAAATLTNTPGYYGGYLYDHITTGTDPDPNVEDGRITVNFGHDYAYCGDPIGTCEYDFSAVILHEMTHLLGFASLVNLNGGNIESIIAPNVFSKFDEQFLYHTNSLNKVVDISAFSGTGGINPAVTSVTSNNIWLNNDNLSTTRTNQPIFSPTTFAFGGSLSHFEGNELWVIGTNRNSISPDFTPNYVMNSSAKKGQAKNGFTMQDIRVLDVLGYNIIGTPASILGNRPPITTETIVTPNSTLYPRQTPPAGDASLYFTTDNCNSVSIDITSINTLIDPDGDALTIYPGSLENIRGCGNGGNNHNQLSVNAGNNIVTFTPRNDFWGRAQFGLHLFDGKERGAFVVFTIDVTKNPNCFNFTSEMMMNGSFEEGRETRLLSDPNVGVLEEVDTRIHYARGWRFADGMEYINGGGWQDPVVRNSTNPCTWYGLSFPEFAPLPTGNVGDRYMRFSGTLEQFNMTLAQEILPCNRYIMEFDLRWSGSTANPYNFDMGFSNSLSFSAAELDFTTVSTNQASGWVHQTHTFIYNGNAPANYLNIKPTSNGYVLIDNISLRLDTTYTPPFSVSTGPDVTVCDGDMTSLSATPMNGTSPFTYSWTPSLNMSGANSPSPTVTPSATTTYTVVVNDGSGCYATDQVTVDVIQCSDTCEIQANFTYNYSPPGCTVEFMNTSTAGPGYTITSYLWDFGDFTTSNLPNPTHTYTTSASYTVCLIVSGEDSLGNTCSDTICQKIGVECIASPCEFTPEFTVMQDDTNCLTAYFTNTTVLPPGLSVVAFEWDFGDGAFDNSNYSNTTHTYATSGVYKVCLTIVATNGIEECKFTFCQEVTIKCSPCEFQPEFSFALNDTNCLTVDFFNNTVLPPGVTVTGFVWNFGDGNSDFINYAGTSHTYATSGTYTVCLTIAATNGFEECKFEFCQKVEVKCSPCEFEPKFTFALDDTNCLTAVFTNLTVLPPGVTVTGFQWDFGDGNFDIFNYSGTSHTYATPGTYAVCLTIAATNGSEECKFEFCEKIEIKCSPCEFEPSFEVNLTDTSCLTAYFTNTTVLPPGLTVTAFEWTFGDGNLDFTNYSNTSHTYSSPGTYTVCLTIAATNGFDECKFKICKEIEINCPPCEFSPNFTSSNFGNCTKAFTNTTPIPLGYSVVNVLWDFGDGNTSNAISPTHTYTLGGIKTVCLTVTMMSPYGEVCERQICNNIKVKCAFQLPCSVTANYNFTGLLGSKTRTFNGTLSTSGFATSITAYKWDFNNDGIIDATGPNPTYTFPSFGNYTVCLRVEGNNGLTSCFDVNCKTVRIRKFRFDVIKLKVAPNPSNGPTNILIDVQERLDWVSVDIYDNMGSKIQNLHTGPLDQGTEQLKWNPSAELANGTYLIKVQTRENSTTEKIILSR